MKSGLIFDVYDDRSGELLRTMYSATEEFSDNVKEASYLSSEDRYALPDDVFALVMKDDTSKLRKFACVDPGNTELSIRYFLETAHHLPAEAQKTAAHNLCVACSWYDLQPPTELLKLAGVGSWLKGKAMGAGITAAMATPTLLGAASEAKQRVGQVLRSAPGGIMTPENFKMAEANGGTAMPGSKSIDTSCKDKVPVKTSSALHTNEHMAPAPSLNKLPSAKMLPAIDVSCSELGCKKEHNTAKVANFALHGRYPLDTLTHVKTAASYFMEYADRFSPRDRHEYCSNVVKQAAAMGITKQLPDLVRSYGSDSYNTSSNLKYAMDQRREALRDEPEYLRLLDELQSKQASISPELFARTLEEFDKEASLAPLYDDRIQDPYRTTFGYVHTERMCKVAGAAVSEGQLRKIAASPTGTAKLAQLYGHDFVSEFQKDPMSIFESMPDDQKMLIMRA